MPGSIIANMPPQDDDDIRKQKDADRKAREADASAWKQIYSLINGLQAQINTQIVTKSAANAATNFALNTVAQELLRVTFTVPTGYTQAQVLGVGSMSCFNQNGSTADQIWGYVDINGAATAAQPGWTPPASGGAVASSYARLLTGLTAGSTFYVRFVGYNRFGLTGAAAGNLNTATINSQVLFLR